MKTRRDFLTCCSLLAAGSVLEPVKSFAAPLLQRPTSPGQFCLTTFERCIHTPFDVILSGRRMVHLELIEARRMGEAAPSGGIKPRAVEPGFSLLLRGPDNVPLSQNTYSFEHQALGRFSMFIVPVCRRRGRECCYEAIFNPAAGAMV